MSCNKLVQYKNFLQEQRNGRVVIRPRDPVSNLGVDRIIFKPVGLSIIWCENIEKLF
jgi:hypothetical protein